MRLIAAQPTGARAENQPAIADEMECPCNLVRQQRRAKRRGRSRNRRFQLNPSGSHGRNRVTALKHSSCGVCRNRMASKKMIVEWKLNASPLNDL
jgi:hypothetical protein